MNRSTLIWTIVLIVAGGYLAVRAASGKMSLVYVRVVEVNPEGARQPWTAHESVNPNQRNEPGVQLSISRTVGIWVGAFLSLCVLSFLYGDNVIYKLAESIFVGSSAAYWAVVSFWSLVIENLYGKLDPALMRDTFLPGLPQTETGDWSYLVPLVLSVMLLWRLAPWGGWISRWPVALSISAMMGLRLVAYFEADFVMQITSMIQPLVVFGADGSVNWGASIRNTAILISVMSCLVYFFFSVEHKGVAGGISRLGIWILMITFGASFGYTVMGRIALLAERLQFLFDDWLWVIDPAARRLGM